MNKQLEELACLYVVDRLDPAERAVFEARLLREPELAGLVRDLESTADQSIRALPRKSPSAHLLTAIERQIAMEPAAETPPSSAVPTGTVRWVNFARWGIAAAIALSLTTLAVQSLRQSAVSPMVVFVGFDANKNTFAELPLREPARDADARFIQLAELAENFWDKPSDVPLRQNPGGSRGYALFDPSSKQGFVAIEQLPAIRENQRYHLWIVDPASGTIRDAGILPLAGTNRGLYSFTLEPSNSSVAERPNFFVTVEEIGTPREPAQPHGKVVLGNRGI